MTIRWATGLILGLTGPAMAQSSFDHAEFDHLLRYHVVRGMVDYDEFRMAPAFHRYLTGIATFDPAGLPRDEQLAFWINAYNAYTIQLILKHDERQSIRNINKTGGLIKGSGPWNEKLARVGGVNYSLDQIEQKIIRPLYREPRIHFALVCAAMGCPPLRSEAYVGARLEAQLEDQGRIFLLESPAKNRVDVAGLTVWVSQVFKFRDYQKDFGGSKEAVARFIAHWYPAGPERQLLEGGRWSRFDYTDYDWTLNSTERAKPMTGTADHSDRSRARADR